MGLNNQKGLCGGGQLFLVPQKIDMISLIVDQNKNSINRLVAVSQENLETSLNPVSSCSGFISEKSSG